MPVRTLTQTMGRLLPLHFLPYGNLRTKSLSEDPPLRAELLSVEQLEKHAVKFAATHVLATGRIPDTLMPRLDENHRILLATHDLVNAAVIKGRPIAAAAEWLLDNFYLIEEQIRMARRHLPPSYGRELPRLAHGTAAKFPRVYGIALELISHVDGRLDAVSLEAFVGAYQTVTALKLGELWAVPIMLRLALIENLRRVAARLTQSRHERDLASDWADRMLSVVAQNPSDLILVLADMARAQPPLSGAFLAELTRHLQGQSPHTALATTWMEHRVAAQGMTIERLVQADGQAQAADQVTIGNSINSLRFLGVTDWRDFVEQQSAVEQTLRTDPAGVYSGMDFATRDQYRHAIEQIARRGVLSEFVVAHRVIALAARGGSAPTQTPAAHVGYYLIGAGRKELDALAQVRRSYRGLTARLIRRYPLTVYMSTLLLLTGAASVAFMGWLAQHASPQTLILVALPVLLGATQVGVVVANWLTTQLVRPQALPRMDYRKGIPRDQRTLVVVPTMLTSTHGVAQLLEALEVRYLANRATHLHFALLTDLVDADEEVMPDDAELVQQARLGVAALQQKYQSDRPDIFFLFHRPRHWNARERVWMGYERKRGKLMELNQLLRGTGTGFCDIVGERSILPEVRYVITLDTDTQLPRDAARVMVGAMAHPLNRPIYDGRCGRVVCGYGIMQPRVGVSLPGSQRSWFTRWFAGDVGVDPYTRVVSDVYQDLFGEGSFIGKGIYDVDAFQQCCGQLPENAILSHDLLESAYARSGLLSDVELYEEYPSGYATDVSRRHRWIRGDWQIARWLLPYVPALGAKLINNPISLLSWWKIFDNLRRSLLPMALMCLLVGAWLLLEPALAGVVTMLVLALPAVGPVLDFLTSVVHKSEDVGLGLHLRLSLFQLGKQVRHYLFMLTFLAYDAWISYDAIARSMLRVIWTHRKLLEWKCSSDVERSQRVDLPGFSRSMWVGPALVLVLAAYGIGYSISWPGPVLALLIMWTLSPLVAWWLSRPLVTRPPRLSLSQRAFLQRLARRTWRYFEVFVTEEDHWLPPDNVQEYPALVVAQRTSPTNIGMALLANLTAYDYGYCSPTQLLDRTAKTCATLGRMEQYRGHFYNWYDTRTLKAMNPQYVSTVDSGNLAGHLLVLRAGLQELLDTPVLVPRVFAGLRTTLDVLHDTLHTAGPTDTSPALLAPTPQVLAQIVMLQADMAHPPNTLRAAVVLLQHLGQRAGTLRADIGDDPETQWWAAAFERACGDHQADLTHGAIWVNLPPAPESLPANTPPEQVLLAQTLSELVAHLDHPATLRTLAEIGDTLQPLPDSVMAPPTPTSTVRWIRQIHQALAESAQYARERMLTVAQLSVQCQTYATMDFTFLLDETSNLFAIGYNVSAQRMDTSFYDLLASEARLVSFVAIAQRQVGLDHWFALGRLLTTTGGATALLSWSGSMFEYLMPRLVMPCYEQTLLAQTDRAIVQRQIDYGQQRGVPWGISESGYNLTDLHLNYQYRAFGVPGLGLKRGLAEDLVVAPYATALALMVAPEAACRNLQRLYELGMCGAYGYYEAMDYTPTRQSLGAECTIIRQFMAHHQGMSLLAYAYLLLDKPMQRRFQADPMLHAADLLLQERIPQVTNPIFPHTTEANINRADAPGTEGTMRVIHDPNSAAPEVHLLSNGRYHVLITAAGGGYSRWGDLAITRWREDSTRDQQGTFLYLRDLDTGKFWSTALQPTLKTSKAYEAVFTQARAEFRRRDHAIETHTEISVSPEDDIELRRVTITNRSEAPRTIEVTSYLEVVLATAAQDLSHPAFSNLFVETELIHARQALLCTRRPRSAEERPPWMVHLMTVRGTTAGVASFETDRNKFIGRGRTTTFPAAMDRITRLSDSAGSVLDPVACIRQVIQLKPNETVCVDLLVGVGETRAAVVALMDKYHDSRLADRVFALAWTHSQVLLRQLNASETEAQSYGRLAGPIIYASARHRAAAEVLTRNRRSQSGLWGYGISGDLPIVLVRIRVGSNIELIHQILRAHAYWRLKGLSVDLVIWNEDDSVYHQGLQDRIMDLVAASPEAALVDKHGGVFVRRGEQMSEEDQTLLLTVARVILQDDAGSLAEQIERSARTEVPIAPLLPQRRRAPAPAEAATATPDLAFFNGLGGFSHDGREYIIMLAAGQTTPAPWSNVLANSHFGTIVTESGGTYTWFENSHEFRLTPWYNDPVCDTTGEAFYLRDEETGHFWSPTPLPARGTNAYAIRHGFGYSIFEYTEDGISCELCVYVAIDAPVKFARFRITNRSGRTRQLSVTGYWEWVLGELRHKTQMHVITALDPISGAWFTRNAYHADFAGRVAFVDCSESLRTVTADRTEFLGRNGNLANPASLHRVRLSGRFGAGLDPCTAMQVPITLAHGQEQELVFVLGAAHNDEHARQLLQRFCGVTKAQEALESVWGYWAHTLGAVHLETPDPAVNFMANGWLIYQTLACRMWARTGFYQSGGAFGFRDQLQDATALIHAEPLLLREHLLRAAAHQFTAGDVQHWWHPPAGRGVRTHFSDDYLWLAYATCRYVAATGDSGVLSERVPFIDSRVLRQEEDANYDLPRVSDDVGTLYEHCLRALDNGLHFGVHGLPVMGGGDWNDGMNLVGHHGQGESVWLAFFLYDVLMQFTTLAQRRGDTATVDKYTLAAQRLRGNIEANAWDGAWYRRAYFDDGTPLGSASNVECQIDSISQSWAVLSGAAPRARGRQAMDNVAQRLIRPRDGLIQLLAPPFDKSTLNPGYIKGYVPGVRENGGQYTHAAIWTAMAFAELGATGAAWDLLALINPINHASEPSATANYRVEPYVVAADVYAVAPHIGRGGWTWYTGSAGWMYRLITESLLGIRLEVDRLHLTPRVPAAWTEFKIHYRYRETFYHIQVHNPAGGTVVTRVLLDGVEQSDHTVPLQDDRRDHQVEVQLGGG